MKRTVWMAHNGDDKKHKAQAGAAETGWLLAQFDFLNSTRLQIVTTAINNQASAANQPS